MTSVWKDEIGTFWRANEERTAWDCQNRLLHFLLHSDRSIFIFDKYWIDIESIDFPLPLLICRTLLISSRNWLSKVYIYRPRRSCEGYVFTPVCLSTGRSASVHAGIPPPPGADTPGADTPRPGTRPPSRRLLLWTVHILLECILV